MKRKINYTFLGIVAVLVIFGMAFLTTLSAPASLQAFGNTNYYLFHQLTALVIGLVFSIIVFKIPIHVLKKMAFPLLFINILLLLVVFLPALGTKFYGAKRWISIGNNSFQPSEFLKITAILYLSAWLSVKFNEGVKKDWISKTKKSYDTAVRVFLPFLILMAIIGGLLFFQKDLSTLGIITITLLVVYFCAGTPLWQTVVVILGGVASALLLVKIEPYRVQRFLVFLHPETDPLGIGFQLRQSLLAVGSGGIFGKGWGMSTQKFGFLPQAMSDSVFAILGEETGIIGCTVLILLFVFFFWQCIKIAKSSNDKFSKLTAVGITTWMVVQAFMNIASAVGMFPLSGIPLPFFSYGGSHVISEMIGVGILLNISKHAT